MRPSQTNTVPWLVRGCTPRLAEYHKLLPQKRRLWTEATRGV